MPTRLLMLALLWGVFGWAIAAVSTNRSGGDQHMPAWWSPAAVTAAEPPSKKPSSKPATQKPPTRQVPDLFESDPVPTKAPVAATKVPTATTAAEAAPNQQAEVSGAVTIEQALKKIVSVEFNEAPISDVVESLKKTQKIEIQLDTKALEEVGVGTDKPVTIKLKNVTLRSALRHILRPLDLVYTIQDEVLLITTPEVIESNLIVEIYPVRDLIQYKDDRGRWQEEATELAELIQEFVQPNTWDRVGGPGSIPDYDGLLVVSQTQEIHAEIAELLAKLRKLPRIDAAEAGQAQPGIRLDQVDRQQEKIDAALKQPIKLTFENQPLGKVVQMLSEQTGINILLDKSELNDVGITPDTKVTQSFNNITLQAALKLLYKAFELSHFVQDEALMIVPIGADEVWPVSVAYPVLDLLPLSAEADSAEISDKLDELIDSVSRTIEPHTWDSVGGPGAIGDFLQRGALVVSNTQAIQIEVAEFLAKLRKARGEQPVPAADRPNADQLELVVYELAYLVIQPEEGKPAPIQPEHIDTEKLALILPELIGADQWQTSEKVLAKGLTDRLVVNQTLRVHRKVQTLLSQMGVSYAARNSTTGPMHGLPSSTGGGMGIFNLPDK